jgi:hypothetical protein
MKKIALFIANAAEKVRSFLSAAFDMADKVIDDVSFVLNEYGDPLTEYLYTNAVKLERAIPAHGFGFQKAVMLDTLLNTVFIPGLERLRGAPLADTAKEALIRIGREKVAKFIAERNQQGDWQQYIEELTRIEETMGIKQVK